MSWKSRPVDPQLGTVFYSLDQVERSVRSSCDRSTIARRATLRAIRKAFRPHGSQRLRRRRGYPILSAGSYRIDQTSPLEKRWGGWYVTGTHGKQTHLGNVSYRGSETPKPIDDKNGLNRTSLRGEFDASGFLTPHSDIAAR